MFRITRCMIKKEIYWILKDKQINLGCVKRKRSKTDDKRRKHITDEHVTGRKTLGF